MTSLVRNFEGGCHCGTLGFVFQTALPATEWAVRACQCRFCRLHGALTTSDSGGRLTFTVGDVDLLESYRFGLRTADFLVCRRCGVYMGAQIETTHGAFGIVNVLSMTPVPNGLPVSTRQSTVLRTPMNALRGARRGGRRLKGPS